MQKTGYSVNGKSLLVRAAAVLMLLSVLFRIIAYWGFWKNQTACFGYTQILLPIVCNIAFAVLILYFGEKHFSLTLVPVLLGVVFFVIKATDMSVLPMLICIAMSILTAFVYTATLLGGAESKWLLAPVFGLPLLYQLIFRDGATLLVKENAMTMDEFIPELSILCILLSLLLVVFAMQKRVGAMETVEGEVVDGAAKTEEPMLPDSISEASQEASKNE